MQNNDNNRGARLVRTVVEQVGWPVAGDVVKAAGLPPRVPITLGGDQTLWVNDPAYLRALATAALAGAHALEAEQPADAGPREDRQETPPVVELKSPLVAPAEGAHVLPAGVDPMGVPCPAECGQQVFAGPNGPVHLIKGGTVAVCRPVDQESTGVFPRIQVEERVG